ncbi:hypothetical protein Tco_1008939 [Tanacetum coccineum]
MADENVPAPTPTRFDDLILPFAAWVPIGKSNYVLDLQKKQKNPIFQILLDETRFVLDANLLREALEITPIDQAHQFVSPLSGDAIMDFVNELGYTEKIHFVSRMAVNNLCQPWRAILSMINQCLTCKTTVYDRPRYPALQMLWGIITSINVDYAELMWEEFVQSIQTFLTDKANLGSPTKKGWKDKPHVIPYFQLTKLIICHLGRTHNIHQRSASSFHLAEEDLRLENLKFISKEMVAKHDQKGVAKKGGKKETASAKQLKPNPAKEKLRKPTPAPKPKLVDEADEEPTQPEPEPEPEPETEYQGEGEEYDVERAIQMSLESFQAHSQAHVGGVAIREPVAEATRPLPVVEGKGKAIVTDKQAAQSLLALHTPKRRSTTDPFIFQRRTPATEEASTGPSAQPQDDTSANIVRDSSSPADAETDRTNSGGDTEILQIGDEQGDGVTYVVNLEDKTTEIDEGQAGSDPGKTPESRPPPDDDKMDEYLAGPNPGERRVALAGPNPKPTHEDFMANVYPNVHESLKFPADEQVILEEPLSHLSSLEKHPFIHEESGRIQFR